MPKRKHKSKDDKYVKHGTKLFIPVLQRRKLQGNSK